MLRKLKSIYVAGALAGTAMFSFAHADTIQSKDFSRLVELSAKRLELARHVALSKWDSGKSIEDPERERAVIAKAVAESAAVSVSETFATNFFSDQIAANKVVQYGLLAQWYREGRAPSSERLNLSTQIRPQLDLLQTAFIREMVSTERVRVGPNCAQQVSESVGEYASSHNLDPLYKIALDRALARTCSWAAD